VAATNDAIVAALNDAAEAWGRVRDGAADADRGKYKAGERAVKKAESQLAKALGKLGDLS
jgi:hypothetical protein